MDAQRMNLEEIKTYLLKVCDLEKQIFIWERVNLEREKITARISEVLSSGYSCVRLRRGMKKKSIVSVVSVLMVLLSAGFFLTGIWLNQWKMYRAGAVTVCFPAALMIIDRIIFMINRKRMITSQKKTDQAVKEILTGQMKGTETEIINLQRQLAELYSKNMIAGEYRNFSAAAQLYYYFNNGVCSTLTGEKGAYNRLEQEIARKDVLICTSSHIKKIRQIGENQPILAQAVRESDRLLDEVCELAAPSVISGCLL